MIVRVELRIFDQEDQQLWYKLCEGLLDFLNVRVRVRIFDLDTKLWGVPIGS